MHFNFESRCPSCTFLIGEQMRKINPGALDLLLVFHNICMPMSKTKFYGQISKMKFNAVTRLRSLILKGL